MLLFLTLIVTLDAIACQRFTGHPLRISFEYSYETVKRSDFQFIKSVSEITAQKFAELLNSIQSPFLIETPRSLIQFDKSNDFTRWNADRAQADLIVFLDVGTCGVLAWASPVSQDSCERTTYGRIRLCESSFPWTFEDATQIMTHELLHLLGIMHPFMERLSKSELVESQPFIVDHPRVVKSLREYYNCQNLIGMPSGGSHWLSEDAIMHPVLHSNDQELTPMTLSTLEALGWYERRNPNSNRSTRFQCSEAPLRARYPTGRLFTEDKSELIFDIVNWRGVEYPVVSGWFGKEIAYKLDAMNFLSLLSDTRTKVPTMRFDPRWKRVELWECL